MLPRGEVVVRAKLILTVARKRSVRGVKIRKCSEQGD